MALAEKLINQMTEEVFTGVKTKPAGMAYQALCLIFPLLEIKSKPHHKAAIEVITGLVNYLNSHGKQSRRFVSEIENYLGTLSALVEKYEQDIFSFNSQTNGADILEYLMKSHHLKQTDLSEEVGGQSVVSQILQGKRELNVRQMRALAKRFNVSPAVFLSDRD